MFSYNLQLSMRIHCSLNLCFPKIYFLGFQIFLSHTKIPIQGSTVFYCLLLSSWTMLIKFFSSWITLYEKRHRNQCFAETINIIHSLQEKYVALTLILPTIVITAIYSKFHIIPDRVVLIYSVPWAILGTFIN